MKLSRREIQVLSKLAEGYTYKEIQSYFGLSAAHVNVVCHTLRKKTGIRQTLNQEECKRAFAAIPPAKADRVLNENPFGDPEVKRLTFCQLDALRQIAMGRTYQQIADALLIRAQSVQNLVSRACKTAGITAKGWSRPQRIRAWLKRHDEPMATAEDLMDDPAF